MKGRKLYERVLKETREVDVIIIRRKKGKKAGRMKGKERREKGSEKRRRR